MKNRIIPLTVILLLLCICLGALSSCRSKNGNEDDDNEKGSASSYTVPSFVAGRDSFARTEVDSDGRVVGRTFFDYDLLVPNELRYEYTYGKNGMLSTVTFGNDTQTLTFELHYNSDKTFAYGICDEYTVNYTFDQKGNLLVEQLFDQEDCMIFLEYGEDGRVIAETFDDGELAHYTYGESSVTMTYYDNYFMTVKAVLECNENGDPVKYSCRSTDDFYDIIWEYSEPGVCTKASRIEGDDSLTLDFKYDGNKRLTSLKKTFTNAETYEYGITYGDGGDIAGFSCVNCIDGKEDGRFNHKFVRNSAGMLTFYEYEYVSDYYNTHRIEEMKYSEGGLVLERLTKHLETDGSVGSQSASKFVRDDEGRILSLTVSDSEGKHETVNTYDENGLLCKEVLSEYTADGTLLSTRTTDMVRDKESARVLKYSSVTETNSGDIIYGDTVSLTYNALGLPAIVDTTSRDDDGNTAERSVISSEFTDFNALAGIKHSRYGKDGALESSESLTLTYDEAKRVESFAIDYFEGASRLMTLTYEGESHLISSFKDSSFDTEGELTQSQVNCFRYDEKGRFTYCSNEMLEPDGSSISKEESTFAYNEQGSITLTEHVSYGEGGRLNTKYSDEFKYHSNGKQAESKSTVYFIEDGEILMISTETYKFDESGNELGYSSIRTDPHGNITGGQVVENELNENGDVKKSVAKTYGEDGSVVQEVTEICEYDEQGNITDSEIKNYYLGVLNSHERNKYTYYSDGNIRTEERITYSERGDILERNVCEYEYFEGTDDVRKETATEYYTNGFIYLYQVREEHDDGTTSSITEYYDEESGLIDERYYHKTNADGHVIEDKYYLYFNGELDSYVVTIVHEIDDRGTPLSETETHYYADGTVEFRVETTSEYSYSPEYDAASYSIIQTNKFYNEGGSYTHSTVSVDYYEEDGWYIGYQWYMYDTDGNLLDYSENFYE